VIGPFRDFERDELCQSCKRRFRKHPFRARFILWIGRSVLELDERELLKRLEEIEKWEMRNELDALYPFHPNRGGLIQ
jgi:hypothetical protein